MADQCRVTECLEKTEPGHLMCGSHWAKVPLVVKQEIYRQRRRGEHGERDAPGLLAQAITVAAEAAR